MRIELDTHALMVDIEKELGVSPQRLKYWIKKGLITPIEWRGRTIINIPAVQKILKSPPKQGRVPKPKDAT